MKKPKTINWAIPIEMLMDDRKLQRAKESKDAIDTALLELGLPRVGTGALENNRSIFKGIEHLLDEPP